MHLPMNVKEVPKVDGEFPITGCMLMKSELRLR